jgi:pyruvate kinase
MDAPITCPEDLLEHLLEVRSDVSRQADETFRRWQKRITRRTFLPSARNLADYLALRQRDLREVQRALAPWGLSTLGRSEARVRESLDAVIATLCAVCNRPLPDGLERPTSAAFFQGERALSANTNALLGSSGARRQVRIMVTLPSEAASDASMLRELVAQGMNCVRINCAHDDADAWARMLKHLRAAEGDTNRRCRVLMDLGGPKLRTEQVRTGEETRVGRGDTVLLTRGEFISLEQHPFQVSCTVPGALDGLRAGSIIWMDDGKIGFKVEQIIPSGVVLRVTHARPKGEKLKPEKGLNFPDAPLNIDPLTTNDLEDLAFVARHADIVGYSFVQQADHIAHLQDELHLRTPEADRIGIVAKIETPLAVRNLPEMIIQAAGRQPFGAMIARGDLAVEIGYQRLAEIQEELLWVCEAAHVPVIWATQVLEHLVKTGVPSRAEITDAAMGGRAECVMLNKGPFLLDAVNVLDDVLRRMQGHQSKKTAQLRALRAWS